MATRTLKKNQSVGYGGKFTATTDMIVSTYDVGYGDGFLRLNENHNMVTISILSRRIEELTGHLKTHKKDNHSRRGLIQMVADRRTHLNYLKAHAPKAFKAVTEKLGL